MKSFIKKEGGFTLIELLVVILIIGILIAVAAPSFLGQTEKATISGQKQDLAVAYRALKAAAVDNANGQGSFSGLNVASALEDSEGAAFLGEFTNEGTTPGTDSVTLTHTADGAVQCEVVATGLGGAPDYQNAAGHTAGSDC